MGKLRWSTCCHHLYHDHRFRCPYRHHHHHCHHRWHRHRRHVCHNRQKSQQISSLTRCKVTIGCICTALKFQIMVCSLRISNPIVDHLLLWLVTNCWLLNVSWQYLIPRLRLLLSKWFTFFSTSNNQSIIITFSADISRWVNGHWLRSRLLFHLIQWSSIYEINAIFFSLDSVLTQDSWMRS